MYLPPLKVVLGFCWIFPIPWLLGHSVAHVYWTTAVYLLLCFGLWEVLGSREVKPNLKILINVILGVIQKVKGKMETEKLVRPMHIDFS